MKEIILAIIQAATEFLPISSDGHLALVSNILGESDLFFITFLHIASLLAVIIFTRREILEILRFRKESWRLLGFILIGIIPAAIVGLFFSKFIEGTLTSYFLIGVFFLFTGIVVFSTKFIKTSGNNLNKENVFVIGLIQAIALFPGVSRSGMTISTGLFFGIDKEKTVKFSFLMFIPLAIGAFLLEFMKYPDAITSTPVLTLIVAFIVCFALSLFFLRALSYIVKMDKFWIFGIYCLFISIVSFILYFI